METQEVETQQAVDQQMFKLTRQQKRKYFRNEKMSVRIKQLTNVK